MCLDFLHVVPDQSLRSIVIYRSSCASVESKMRGIQNHRMGKGAGQVSLGHGVVVHGERATTTHLSRAAVLHFQRQRNWVWDGTSNESQVSLRHSGHDGIGCG